MREPLSAKLNLVQAALRGYAMSSVKCHLTIYTFPLRFSLVSNGTLSKSCLDMPSGSGDCYVGAAESE